MATSVKNNFVNLALIRRRDILQEQEHQQSNKAHESAKVVSFSTSSSGNETKTEENLRKPLVVVTNGQGVESPGLAFLVDALVQDDLLDVHVCATQSDRSVCAHSVTTGETLAAYSAQVGGATAYEVSGTPADCVSLALSGALFSWSKPLLVISGLNKGAICGHDTLHSGAIAAAREALICGVPSLCMSLNWKKNVSSQSDLKDAVTVCLPLIHAAIRDIKKGIFPKNCFLNIGIPSSPLSNKGVKVTKPSPWRSSLSWQAVSSNRQPPSGTYMSNQQSLGIMLAQLGKQASAAGAARRLNSNKKNVEIESVGAAGKPSSQQTVKRHFKKEIVSILDTLQLTEKEMQNVEDNLDLRALEEGFVTVTPLSLYANAQTEIHSSVSNWLATALTEASC